MSVLGYIIAFIVGFVIVFLLGFVKRKKFTATLLISALLGGGTATLASHLNFSIKGTIEERALIADKESAIIEKLKFIREAEIAYQEVNGKYTSDFGKLVDFIKNGRFPIIQKKERVVTLSYGADSSIVTYDTLEIISAKKRIFEASYNVNSANKGIFQGFKVAKGDKAFKGSGAYTLNQNGKNVTHNFKESGTVSALQGVNVGDAVEKGDLLMSLLEIKFDPNTNIDSLAYVPGHSNVKFEIYAAKVDKNGSMVDVIEVKNPKPVNPLRSEGNDAKNRKPLRFGSKIDVTTSGNWE